MSWLSSSGAARQNPARTNLWLGLAAWIVVALLAALATGEVARRDAQAELARQAQAAAALHAAVLRSELEKHRSLPLALSGDPDIASLLRSRTNAADAVNAKLEGLARQTRAAAIYVIDAGGRTRAASNWRLPTSFVGADYGFRPYFINTMRSGQAEFFALGTVSGRPGLYLARRVDAADGAPLGVVVVKVEFDALEAEWRASGEPAYVVDPTGVVLITSVPDWRFRTLDPLDEARRRLTPDRPDASARGAAPPALRHAPERAAAPDPDGPHRRGAALDARRRRHRYAGLDAAPAVAQPGRGGGRRGQRTRLGGPDRDPAGGSGRGRAAPAPAGPDPGPAPRRTPGTNWNAASTSAPANSATPTPPLSGQIEERRRAEAARERLRDELVQASKLAALGQIVASVAHEINQPVAAIQTQAETAAVLLDRQDAVTARTALSRIGDLTQRIGSITENLRTFSRKTDPKIGVVRLDEAIHGALLLTRGRLDEGGVALIRRRGRRRGRARRPLPPGTVDRQSGQERRRGAGGSCRRPPDAAGSNNRAIASA